MLYMKFILTESKLQNLVFKYLDNQDFVRVDIKYGFDLLNSVDDDVVQIYYENSTKTCIISHNLIREIRDFFSFEKGTGSAALVISKWVENKFGVVVDNLDTDIIFRNT